jgi:hypothetical protein
MAMSEPIKVLPMAELLRLAKQKQAREDATIPEITTVPISTTVAENTPVPEKPRQLYRNTTGVKSTTVPESGIVPEKFTPIPNGILDSVLSRLKPSEQVVLLRLYRLSRGFHSETCRVGFNTLARSCNISKTTAQVTIARLVELRYIEVIGVEQGGSNKQERGTIYKVNLPSATIPKSGTVPKNTTVVKSGTVAEFTTNKENTLKETHTNTEPAALGVRVGSRFDLQECRRYAEHLRSSGQGITNPGGYSQSIYKSGAADDAIQEFLNRQVEPTIDASECKVCAGSGFYYPNGHTGGVSKCKHEELINSKKAKP